MENRLGQQLGNYRLVRFLARGGFAEVYVGQHIYLENQAALKILLERPSGADSQSFLKEARMLVRLVHPNIVRVLDFGIEDETPFLVMDYAPHGSLRQLYPKGARLPLSLVTMYLKQAASALSYAHGQNMVHRDIKPENLLLGRTHELLVSDFGIAIFARSSQVEGTQQVVGTIAYMAPEQVRGKPRPASDQYALALVTYEWLCGERPFHGNLAEIAAQQLFSDPPSLREKVPDLPPAVEQVLKTALAKDPAQRYDTILDFAGAFEQAACSPSPIEAKAPTFSQQIVFTKHDATPAADHTSPTSRTLTDGDAVPSVHHISPEVSPANRVPNHASVFTKTSFINANARMSRFFVITLGVLLFALLSNLLVFIHLPPLQGNELLWFAPALVIPVAYGALYGFWAGLIVGGVGYWPGSFLALAIHPPAGAGGWISLIALSAFTPPWYFSLGFLACGSIAGLATRITGGRYRTIRDFILADLCGISGLLCGFFMIFNGFWPRLYPYETVWLDFTHIALPNVVLLLILLPLVLVTQRFLSRPTHMYESILV